MNSVKLRRHALTLAPQSERVLIRPFIPGETHLVTAIIGRALALSEEEVVCQLQRIRHEFDARHFDIESTLLAHFEKIRQHILGQPPLSRERQLLLGALFSGEYALESAAIFNPSIVPHPDQGGLEVGDLRFIMSLRATGEGHISSIEFRSGVITANGGLILDPVSRFVAAPEVLPNPDYDKKRFVTKLHEMGVDDGDATAVMARLSGRFTRSELDESLAKSQLQAGPQTQRARDTLARIRWLAESNYELRFSAKLAVSERIIFPVSSNEANGIEDARFVRFTDDDGSVMYYATYTAYSGRDILPQLIETKDFLHFRILTLSGDAVENKGMALFPRRIGGRYAMLSRQDDENLFIMFSDSPHHWSDPQLLLRPREMWESVKIGNCGSPIETDAGWLVITHGVGPMRKYCIGAVLLDLHDPRKVIARLRHPLLRPEGTEREGYVPNVVYSCGSLLHNGELVLPFAVSDRASVVSSVPLKELLTELLSNHE
jgi:predicted GH43/DUF377 family glycosyl hydrolase